MPYGTVVKQAILVSCGKSLLYIYLNQVSFVLICLASCERSSRAVLVIEMCF